MNLNLPAQVRKAVYILATISTPTLYYFNQQTVVNDFWFGLYSVVMTAVTALAALNVTPDEK